MLCLCTRLLICALWSPAGRGLTSWLSFRLSNCEFVTFPLVSWVRCATWLYRFLIFATLLLFLCDNSWISFVRFRSTVLPVKDNSDVILCLQLLNKTLTCTLHLRIRESIGHMCILVDRINTNLIMFGIILKSYLSSMLWLKFHEDNLMQARKIFMWIHVLFVYWKTQNFSGKYNILPF